LKIYGNSFDRNLIEYDYEINLKFE